MSYWETANPGTRLVKTAYETSAQGVGVQLVGARPPLYPGEFAATAVNVLIPTLLGAERAREFADSYRDFRVGAAAVAYFYSERGSRSLQLAHGANVKPTQGSDEINVHAEQMIMAAVEAKRQPDEDVYVPLMAVVGDLQPDQQSGEQTLTLHPCGVCRDAVAQADTAVDERTLFVTANPSMTTLEWFGVAALARLHAGDAQAPIGRAKFDERSPILTQPDIPEKGYISVADVDTPELLAAEEEYNAKVQLPVLQYWMQYIG